MPNHAACLFNSIYLGLFGPTFARDLKDMSSIESFIHRKVVILDKETTARDAARAMRENHIGCVLAADSKGQLVGIVTDRDFACQLVADYSDTTAPISQIMSHDLITANEDSSLSHVLQLMETHGIRRVPILASGHRVAPKCVGIVTLDDLMATYLVDSNQIARIIRRQIGRRVMAPAAGPRTLRSELRSDARAQQTLVRFYKSLAEAMELEEELIPEATAIILGLVFQRIPYSGVVHFISQLPRLLHHPLLDVPSGPNREITVSQVINELMSRFQVSEVDAELILRRFFVALDQLIDSGQMNHLKAQLPKEFLDLFERPVAEEEIFVASERGSIPACDVDETETQYLISLDLPGIGKQDLKIQAMEGQLLISGERKRSKTGHLSTERFYGPFQRMFNLPQPVDIQKIEANYEDGVLQIAIPKLEIAVSKRVEIRELKSEVFEKSLSREKEIKLEKIA